MVKNQWLALNRALFLPALSKSFVDQLSRGGSIAGIPLSKMDFLDPSAPWHYPFALYSGGQIDPKSLSVPQPCRVMSRSRADTVVLGDSGGYQIATGQIAFDPVTTAPNMLNWMEHMADWSMCLDFPTGLANSGDYEPHMKRLMEWGVDVPAIARAQNMSQGYCTCLIMTTINNNRFVRERRPGATGLLNVLQGRNHFESQHWYEAMKHYPFEGWAFAGAHQSSPSMVVARLLDLHRDGLLGRCQWLHVLGTASLEMGCVLTAIQREVRALGYAGFQITLDASSATSVAKYGKIVIGHTVSEHGWAMQSASVSDLLTRYAGDQRPLWELLDDELQSRTERDDRARGLAYTHASRQARLSDLDPNGEGRLSGLGYNLAMWHNSEAYIIAHTEVQDGYYEQEAFFADPLRRPLTVTAKEAAVRQLFAMPDGQRVAKEWSREFLDVWTDAATSRRAA